MSPSLTLEVLELWNTARSVYGPRKAQKMGMMERMHGMGPAPRTMYMNRQTGMLMQPDVRQGVMGAVADAPSGLLQEFKLLQAVAARSAVAERGGAAEDRYVATRNCE